MLTNKEAVKVLTAAEQEAARREAEIWKRGKFPKLRVRGMHL